MLGLIKRQKPPVKHVQNTFLVNFNIFANMSKQRKIILSSAAGLIVAIVLIGITFFSSEATHAEKTDSEIKALPLINEDTVSNIWGSLQDNGEAQILKIAENQEEMRSEMQERYPFLDNNALEDIMSSYSSVEELIRNINVEDKVYEILGSHHRANLVLQYADHYEIPSLLVVAIILVESTNKPTAKSRVGARGLMQLMPATAELIAINLGMNELARQIKANPNVLYDEDINIRFGCNYFKYLYTKFGKWEYALHAYNMGPGGFKRGARNYRYANKIMTFWQTFEQELYNNYL